MLARAVVGGLHTQRRRHTFWFHRAKAGKRERCLDRALGAEVK
jgi:hypothetical protein